MDALVIVCSWNTDIIMDWAWMLWSSYALGTQTLLWIGHGCSGHRMLLEHRHYYGLGMDALVIVCSWNTNIIMVWAWMLWSSYALGTRILLWFGHGCSGHHMLCGRAPHGGNAFPLRTDPGASPASKKSCWNYRTQGPRGCVPPKTSLGSMKIHGHSYACYFESARSLLAWPKFCIHASTVPQLSELSASSKLCREVSADRGSWAMRSPPSNQRR